MTPLWLLLVSLAVLAIGALLTAATSRVNATTLDSRMGAGRIAAAVAVLADAAGVIGVGVAVVLLLTG